MDRRDTSMGPGIRRGLIGAAAGAIIALAATSGVSAHWHAQQRLDLESVSTGDLLIDAAWRDGPPAWSPLLPGASTPDTVIQVSSSSAGTTLRWRLRVVGAVSAPAQQHVTFSAWRGVCGTGTPIPAGGTAALPVDAVVDVCIRYTLSPSAPATLQNTDLAPRVTLIAEQVVS